MACRVADDDLFGDANGVDDVTPLAAPTPLATKTRKHEEESDFLFFVSSCFRGCI